MCSPEFGPLIESFAAGVSAWAAEHADQLSRAAAAVLAGLGGAITAPHVYAHCLRVIHYDWIVSPTRLAARLRAAKVEVHGSNEWAIGPSRSASGAHAENAFLEPFLKCGNDRFTKTGSGQT